jgi:N-methylhydantoinase B
MFDPIAMEVFSNRLLSITEDMGNTLVRASFSPNIKERKDCSVALFDAGGRLVAQAAHIPIHLGSLAGGVHAVLSKYGENDISDGDAFIANDAYMAGGTHAPDIMVITPIFCESRLSFFAANIGHHSDVGGGTPGSVTPNATTVFDEGLRIPPIPIARKGRLEQGTLDLITTNSREPEDRMVDLKVQVAANEKGKRLLLDLVRQLGIENVERSVEDVIAYTSRRLRWKLRSLGNCSGSFTTYLDDDGFGGDPVPICATITVFDETLIVDFTGSGPQSRGSYNMPESALRACAFYAVKTMLDPDLVANEGMVDAIQVKSPLGTITGPVFPAAIGMRQCTAQRVAGAIIGAFAELLPPEQTMASSNDAMPALVVSGQSRRRAGTYVYVETIGGGVGGRFDADGMDGAHVHITNSSNLPAEALENEYPLLVEEYGLVPDSGGCGEFRGGMGIARQIRALDDNTFFYASTEGTRIAAAGLHGGGLGGLGRILLDPGSPYERILPANQPGTALKAGQAMRVETPGGGGFGPAQARAVDQIALDLIGGKISFANAERDYGVEKVTAAKAWIANQQV